MKLGDRLLLIATPFAVATPFLISFLTNGCASPRVVPVDTGHGVYMCDKYWCQQREEDSQHISSCLYWIESTVDDPFVRKVIARTMTEHWEMVKRLTDARLHEWELAHTNRVEEAAGVTEDKRNNDEMRQEFANFLNLVQTWGLSGGVYEEAMSNAWKIVKSGHPLPGRGQTPSWRAEPTKNYPLPKVQP